MIDIGVSNTYGGVLVYKDEDGKHYISLGDYSGVDRKEISEEFYLACQKEFGKRS